MANGECSRHVLLRRFNPISPSLFQWRPPQEEELRIESSDLKGANGAAGRHQIRPTLSQVAEGGHGECPEQEYEAEEGQRRMGR